MFSGWYDRASRPSAQYSGLIPASQVGWELTALIGVYSALDPMRVLEIGSELGGTLYHWLTGAQPGATVVNIDILQNQKPAIAASLPDAWASWTPAGVTYHPIIGRSDDAAVFEKVTRYLPDGIDFLFIDACHTYEGVRYDFLKYGPLVRKGGVIALHDLITPEKQQHIQVWQLWREIQAAGYKTQELRANAAWGGVGVIYIE